MDFAQILDLATRVSPVAIFTTAAAAVVFGTVNRRHERRKALKDGFDNLLANAAHRATLSKLEAANSDDVVYKRDLRAAALDLLIDLRRVTMTCSHADVDAVLRSSDYHILRDAVARCERLITIVQRTNLTVAERPIWNGRRRTFAQPVLRAFQVRLGRP